MAGELTSFWLSRGRGVVSYGGVQGFTLSRAIRILVEGDSQPGGRGTGDGSVQMDGARILSLPTRAGQRLKDIGFEASWESFFECNNTGGSWNLYDPRVNPQSWLYSAAGSWGTGGRLLYSNASGLGVPSFSPATPVDTFEIYTPINTYGQLNYNIDGANNGQIPETGTPSFGKRIATAPSVAMRVLNVARDNTVGGSAFLNGVVAYDSTKKDIRIINASARGWSTVDWLVADQPWRPFPGIETLAPDIGVIMLGTNDRLTTGANISAETFKANMQALIAKNKVTAQAVILVLPMPISLARAVSFDAATLLRIYQELSAENGCPLIRSDSLLGTWEAANDKGLVADELHWKAPASDMIGKALAWYIAQAAKGFAA